MHPQVEVADTGQAEHQIGSLFPSGTAGPRLLIPAIRFDARVGNLLNEVGVRCTRSGQNMMPVGQYLRVAG